MSLAGAGTLFRKEVLRFWKVSFQTVAAPVLTSLLYLLIFSHVLESNVKVYDGRVAYTAFLIPGLVIMSVLQNAFANSSSSLIQSKVTGNIVFVLLDDAGFSDLGSYGSEIATPNLDAIARQGVPLAVVYSPPTNPLLDELLNRWRTRIGCELLARWFYFHGGYQKRLLPGKRVLLTATPSKFRDSLQVTHPELTELPPRTESDDSVMPEGSGHIRIRYPDVEGVPGRLIERLGEIGRERGLPHFAGFLALVVAGHR